MLLPIQLIVLVGFTTPNCTDSTDPVSATALAKTVGEIVEQDLNWAHHMQARFESLRLEVCEERLGVERVAAALLRVGTDHSMKREVRVAALDQVGQVPHPDTLAALLATAYPTEDPVTAPAALRLLVRSKTARARDLFAAWKPSVIEASRFFAEDALAQSKQDAQTSITPDGPASGRSAAVLGAFGELCALAPSLEPKLCSDSLRTLLTGKCTRSSYDAKVFAGALVGFAAVSMDAELRRPFLAQCGYTNHQRNPPLGLLDVVADDAEPFEFRETALQIMIDRLPGDSNVVAIVKNNLVSTNTDAVVRTLRLLAASPQRTKWRMALKAELARLRNDRFTDVADMAQKVAN